MTDKLLYGGADAVEVKTDTKSGSASVALTLAQMSQGKDIVITIFLFDLILVYIIFFTLL